MLTDSSMGTSGKLVWGPRKGHDPPQLLGCWGMAAREGLESIPQTRAHRKRTEGGNPLSDPCLPWSRLGDATQVEISRVWNQFCRPYWVM